ncbi:hypothetical protein QNI16_29295 [Cytophagaceae bacterium YF14B1]|uniref:Uncharacterized protein n=1 Tax=Xanthocytophaga flava TaxID=3048013 RepID=A0AAE3QWR4_9BACT|nr:hypothetical protein [Xanthocytophaga flavus]MDJ1484630.1 hypothetical protein [Xanthocytophaga flavus]
MLKKFERMPFDNEVYYFKESPEELIAIRDNESIGYVYNPHIRDAILDGLSPSLPKKEKERIGNRIQSFLRKYQCKSEHNHRYGQEYDDD